MRYHLTIRLLHWVMVALLIWLVWGGLALRGMGFTDAAAIAYNQHKAIGVLAFVLAVLRLALRLIFTDPPHEENWRGRLSLSVQVGLYSVLFLYPISGYFFHAASKAKAPLILIGWPVPDWWIGPAAFWHDVHHTCLQLLALFLILHIAGALWHLIQRDGLVRRILPF